MALHIESDRLIGLGEGKVHGLLPGLVNVDITNWNITMLLMGKSTISTEPFSMSQTVSLPEANGPWVSHDEFMGRVTSFLLVRHVDGVLFFRSFEGTVFHGDFQFFITGSSRVWSLRLWCVGAMKHDLLHDLLQASSRSPSRHIGPGGTRSCCSEKVWVGHGPVNPGWALSYFFILL